MTVLCHREHKVGMNPATTVMSRRVGACPRLRYEAEAISTWNGIDCFAEPVLVSQSSEHSEEEILQSLRSLSMIDCMNSGMAFASS